MLEVLGDWPRTWLRRLHQPITPVYETIRCPRITQVHRDVGCNLNVKQSITDTPGCVYCEPKPQPAMRHVSCNVSYSAIWMVWALVTLSFRKQCLRLCDGQEYHTDIMSTDEARRWCLSHGSLRSLHMSTLNKSAPLTELPDMRRLKACTCEFTTKKHLCRRNKDCYSNV